MSRADATRPDAARSSTPSGGSAHTAPGSALVPHPTTHPHPKARRKLPEERMTRLQLGGLIVGIALFFAPILIGLPGLDPSGARMFGIFLLAVVFWITAPIPLYATAILVILLEVLLISDNALFAVPDDAPAYTEVFGTLANPTIILFMGGFMIADAAAKYDIDKAIAARVLKPFGTVRGIVFALMMVSAVLSMFVSNTATTATMFAVILPVLKLMPSAKAKTGLALSVPLGANIGGMGTPVGSPPNAIVIAMLAENGIHISFLQWMAITAIPMISLLLVAYLMLTVLFLPARTPVSLDFEAPFATSRRAICFYAIAATTIGLWLTEPLHGIPSNIVGFLPVVALIATGVMNGKDVQNLEWPVLWLVAGGIALGSGVGKSGLDAYLIGLVDWGVMGGFMILLVLGLVTLIVATTISNTATTNLLAPLAITIAMSAGVNPAAAAILVGLVSGCGIALPVSTPPNAIAFATGVISVKDMAIIGVGVGVAAIPIVMMAMPWVWTTLGLL